METTNIVVIVVVAINGLLGLISTGIIAYANRNKTSAEAEQIKADTTATLTQAVTSLVGQIKDLSDSVNARDARLDTLEREAREKDGKIDTLVKQVEELTRTVADKDCKINDLERRVENLRESGESKDRQILDLEKKVSDMEKVRQKDQARQEKIETERGQLRDEVARLREKLEAKNGEIVAESPAETPKPADGGGGVIPVEG